MLRGFFLTSGRLASVMKALVVLDQVNSMRTDFDDIRHFAPGIRKLRQDGFVPRRCLKGRIAFAAGRKVQSFPSVGRFSAWRGIRFRSIMDPQT
jgi:hypothetical protein